MTIQIIHESVFITIGAILFMTFANYQKDVHESTLFQILAHPFTLAIISLEWLIVLQIPYYTVVILVGTLASSIYFAMNWNTVDIGNKT